MSAIAMKELPAQDPGAFVGKVVADLGAAFSGVLVNIGRELGLYDALSELGPCTSEELAAATKLRERYVREWLSNQAAGGYLTYDAAGASWYLPPAHALVLASPDSPVYMAQAFEVAAAFWEDEKLVLDAFKSGEGIGWHQHSQRLFCGTEMFFRTGYRTHLTTEWLPALEGVVERLELGAKVADIGCGHGVSTTLMAQAYPRSRFVGFDYHAESIERSRQQSNAEGVINNLDFEVATATDFPGKDYDLICFMDCLHDLGDPVGALAHSRRALKDDGKVMLVEPFAGDSIEENLNPVGRLFYAASTLSCTPGSLAQEVGLGLGAQAGEQRLRELALEAGFSGLRRAASTPFNLILELSK